MLEQILDRNREQLLSEEREWLARLQVVLARFDVSADEQAILGRSIRQLDQLFLLVVVGEFNAGKSAFINALLGQSVLEEGVTPTTSRIQVLTHGDTLGRTATGSNVDVITAPVDLLREINIVDTPGTNAIYREHEALTSEFVPRSDLVLFVTSADRPFTESERAFLEAIREWGKKVVIVVNKVDILESADDVARVTEFVTSSAQSLLRATPEVFTLSSRQALRAKLGEPTTGPVTGDRFAELEQYVASTLDQEARVRLKLLNPLGVGMRLIASTLEVTDSRLAVLAEDVATIQDIDAQLETYRTDLQREFRFRLSGIDATLHEFENRGVEFFDETLQLTRALDLLNKPKLQAAFERTVVGETPQTIERSVSDAIDWLVASELRQWQGVMDRLQARRNAHAERIVGEVGGTFSYDRAHLIDTVGRAAQQAIDAFDQGREASHMAESVRLAVAGAALAEAGAIGLGAIVSMLATTTFADVTGIIAAGAVAVLGLFVIPFRRQQAKRSLRRKIGAMREQLMEPLTRQFDREVDRNLERIRSAIAPYTRFVHGEREQLETIDGELRAVDEGLGALKARIDRG
jgi:small GTP-binding protein